MSLDFKSNINFPIKDVQFYCATRPIKRLALFGSILRDDFHSESDVDMLVEYMPDATITLLDMAMHEMALSSLINHKVDLRTANELSPYFRQTVVDQAQVIYEHK